MICVINLLQVLAVLAIVFVGLVAVAVFCGAVVFTAIKILDILL